MVVGESDCCWLEAAAAAATVAAARLAVPEADRYREFNPPARSESKGKVAVELGEVELFCCPLASLSIELRTITRISSSRQRDRCFVLKNLRILLMLADDVSR